MKVTFSRIQDINTFVNFISTLSGKVYLKSGEIKVNAKSIIGVMYIVQEHPDNISLEVEDPNETEKVMEFLMDGKHLLKD